MSIQANLELIQQEIATAAQQAGRDPAAVRLVAVSKTKAAAMVIEAAKAGQRLFGENYVQELVEKAPLVQEAVEWHFIGHLQSNKVRFIAGLVSMIHSVDRLSLALEIDRQWGRIGKTCDVLLQVNVSGEATKSGTTTADAITLAQRVAQLPNLRIRGLMTMPPFFDDPDGARPYFHQLQALAAQIEALAIPGVSMAELSMGMSGDFVPAIAEGATLVRIGSAIFGQR